MSRYKENSQILYDNIFYEKGYLFCEICKANKGIDPPHHIIWRSEKPNHPELHELSNLILLCRNCHNEFHDKKGKRNKLVLSRQLHLIFGNDVLNK